MDAAITVGDFLVTIGVISGVGIVLWVLLAFLAAYAKGFTR